MGNMKQYHEGLLARIQALEDDAALRKRRARAALWGVAASLAFGITAASRPAWSQACAESLPAPLSTFCAGQPARVADVNGNFRKIYDWINRKLGDPTSGRVLIATQDEAGPQDRGGSLVIGPLEGDNLALDSNEIVARSKGVGATLSIQANGGAGDTVLNAVSGNVGVGVAPPRAKLDVGGSVLTRGDVRNTNPDGQIGVSSGFAFCDTGDNWLRLRAGPDSQTYADLAVNHLWTEQKLIRMLLLNMGKNVFLSTGVADADWDCWVGGVDFPDGDIDEYRSGTIMSAFTYSQDGVWHVKADFRSHQRDEDHNIRVVCARDGIVQRDSW